MLRFNKQLLIKQQVDSDEEGGGSSRGGSGGKVEFKDFTGIAGKPLRDDMLPPDEVRRLLIVAASSHKESVKKEKIKRDAIKAVKENKMSVQDFRQQMGGGGSEYKSNPILANKVQFSGSDKQVTNIPTDSMTNTNNEAKNELKNEYRLTNKLQYEARPQFNPQPKPGY